MVKLDVSSQVAREKRHEDQLPARRQDARTLLTCARELRELPVWTPNTIEMTMLEELTEKWIKRAKMLEGERAPGFLSEDDGET